MELGENPSPIASVVGSGGKKMNSSLTIHALKLSDVDFEQIIRANPEWKFEQTVEGELVVVPPTGGTSGYKKSHSFCKTFQGSLR